MSRWFPVSLRRGAHSHLVILTWFSDYDLDDGKGEEFVRECRATRPRLPVIAVSSHEAGNAALVAAGASAVCSKMEFDRIQQVIGGLEHERI